MPSASRRDDRFARQHPPPGQGFTRRGFDFRYFILRAIYRVGLDPVGDRIQDRRRMKSVQSVHGASDRGPRGLQAAGALGASAAAFAATFLALRERLIPGADPYYHLAIARAISLGGVPLDLPWVRLSAMHVGFGDKEVLFHLLLARSGGWRGSCTLGWAERWQWGAGGGGGGSRQHRNRALPDHQHSLRRYGTTGSRGRTIEGIRKEPRRGGSGSPRVSAG